MFVDITKVVTPTVYRVCFPLSLRLFSKPTDEITHVLLYKSNDHALHCWLETIIRLRQPFFLVYLYTMSNCTQPYLLTSCREGGRLRDWIYKHCMNSIQHDIHNIWNSGYAISVKKTTHTIERITSTRVSNCLGLSCEAYFETSSQAVLQAYEYGMQLCCTWCLITHVSLKIMIYVHRIVSPRQILQFLRIFLRLWLIWIWLY